MAGDEKLILQVGSVNRATPVRKAMSGMETPAPISAPAVSNSPPPVPVAKLISLARELGEQAPPVDYARIATLRSAIASGAYSVDAALVANAAARFYTGGAH